MRAVQRWFAEVGIVARRIPGGRARSESVWVEVKLGMELTEDEKEKLEVIVGTLPCAN